MTSPARGCLSGSSFSPYSSPLRVKRESRRPTWIVAGPHQETFGILEIDEFIQKIEKQQVEGVIFQLHGDPLTVPDRREVFHHDVHRCIGGGGENLLLGLPRRPEGDVGDGDLFQVGVRHRVLIL